MRVHSKIKAFYRNVSQSEILSTIFLINTLLIYPYINRYFDGQTHLVLSLNKTMWTVGTPLLIFLLFNKVIIYKSITDKILLILTAYLVSSLLVFAFFNQGDFTFIFRELFYSVLPIFCYFIYRGNPNIGAQLTISTILLIVFVVGISGLWGNSNLPKPFFIAVLKNKSYINFQSFYSPIIYASLGPSCLAILLFKKIDLSTRIKMVMGLTFIITSILTLQRAAFLGIIMAIAFFVLFRFNRYIFVNLAIIILTIYLSYNFIEIDPNYQKIFTNELNWKKILAIEIADFNLGSVVHQRRDQTFIFNDYSLFKIFFGEGFGKYSPQNTSALLIMPDASYQRLFNELGLIGCALFVSAFASMFLEFLKNRNIFGFFLLSFVLVHFYFNRILMAIPSAYFIYILLGVQLQTKTNRK